MRVTITMNQQLNTITFAADGSFREPRLIENRVATQTYTGPLVSPEQLEGYKQLFFKLQRHFNEHELWELCFALNVEYEALSEKGKTGKMLELVLLMGRTNRLPEFFEKCAELRPNVDWLV